MKRSYEDLLVDHFINDRQMAFITGPRQVGKTTTTKAFAKNPTYFTWDDEDHRSLILAGPNAVTEKIGLAESRVVVFDELHKYPDWKNFTKGFFDTRAENRFQVVVTGSARLDVYRKGSDSLMGRYFLYRMHPLSVAEIVNPRGLGPATVPPTKITTEDFAALRRFGGFPEPFLRRNARFHNRWKQNRLKLLFREELRDTTKILEIGQVELLAEFLKQSSGRQISYASLARMIRASQDSIRRWISVLESLYYCFLIRPWSHNLPRSLIKEPKVYLWDWSVVADPGARNENLVASHLLKAVHWWQDTGLGEYGLHYLRTKDKREVDFLVTREGAPWFLVEVKTSRSRPLNKNLAWFQEHTGASHAFQVVMDAEFINANPFDITYPVQVSAQTFLSQLV